MLQLTFDLDVRANAFEMNIRLLGGLLSAHLLAEDSTLGLMPRGYAGGLLDLALQLGERLMPAFTASPTGVLIPDSICSGLFCLKGWIPPVCECRSFLKAIDLQWVGI